MKKNDNSRKAKAATTTTKAAKRNKREKKLIETRMNMHIYAVLLMSAIHDGDNKQTQIYTTTLSTHFHKTNQQTISKTGHKEWTRNEEIEDIVATLSI